MQGNGGSDRDNRPICRKCRHYYITHDPEHPFGCRAMRFKSRRNPALVVFASSGMQCQLFCLKKGTKPGPGGSGKLA